MTDATHRDDIHRLLDEAFVGVELTPDSQDLKEEMRANLVARVAELEASGHSPVDAPRRAIAELGDIGDLLDAPGVEPEAGRGGRGHSHRVRPEPALIVGIVVAALAATIGLLLATLGAIGVLPLPVGVLFALVGITATGVAWIVGDSLAHETTTNHPMPVKRASGYFLASLLAAYGLGLGGLIALLAIPAWVVIFAAFGVVAAIIGFALLGATQTNRRKAWARAQRRDRPALRRRFDEEPETAARFVIYTVVIWVVAFTLFVVLSFTLGWVWSWLALLGGFAAMMILMARMMFGPVEVRTQPHAK